MAVYHFTYMASSDKLLETAPLGSIPGLSLRGEDGVLPKTTQVCQQIGYCYQAHQPQEARHMWYQTSGSGLGGERPSFAYCLTGARAANLT
jgi:hypothetical protein